MKSILKGIAVLCFFAGATFAQTQKRVKHIQSIEIDSIDKTPQSIIFSDDITGDNQLQDIFRTYWDIDGSVSRAVVVQHTETKQQTSVEQYEQQYKGIKIENGVYKVLYDAAGRVRFMNGNFYKVPATLQPTAKVTADKALSYALDAVHAKTYAWQAEGLQRQLKREKNDTSATYYPVGSMVWVEDMSGPKRDKKLHLAYKFDVYALEPLSREHIYIDAVSGKVLYRNSLIAHTTGSGPSLYSGTVSFQTTLIGGLYSLRDSTRGNGINTWTCAGTDGSIADEVTNASATFGSDAAIDAHWGATKVYDYWYTQHGRNSFDNTGRAINSFVHYGIAFNNAFWNGAQMIYGDGSGLPYGFSSLTSIDVVAHEIGHAVCQYTAGLQYNRESGALNEGFSDIWGAVVEAYADPHETDAVAKDRWAIGEEIGANPIRRMNNPNSRYQPDTYGGTLWFNTSGCIPSWGNDYCGVHTNSGVLNYWFYLLSQGGTGTNDIGNSFAVTGQGITKAALIAYQTELLLTATSTFANCRTASISAASTLYGPCSPETEAVTRAWYAVGVGANYSGASVSSVMGAGAMCIGATTMFSTVTTGGTWVSSAPGIALVSSSGLVTGIAAGTANISYRVVGGCYAKLTATVSAPAAVSAIGGASSICQFATSTLSNTTSGGTWNSSDTSIAKIGTSTGVLLGIAPGTATITYSFTNSCSSASTTAVRTINAAPAAITGTFHVCVGNSTTLSSATSGGTWTSSTPAVATVGSLSGIVSSSTAGTTRISYFAIGCAISALVTVVDPYADSSFEFFRTDSARLDILPAPGHTRTELYDPSAGFTWEAWVYMKDTNYTQVCLIATEDSVLYEDFFVSTGWNGVGSKSQLTFLISSNVAGWTAQVNSTTRLMPQRWYHVAAVCNYPAGTFSLYLDGAVEGSGTIPWGTGFRLTRDIPTMFGNGYSQKYASFNGFIDEVKFWKGARTAAQVLADTTSCITYPQPNLVAYFKAREGSGTYTGSTVNGNFTGYNAARWGDQAPVDCPASLDITGMLEQCTGNTYTLVGSSAGGVWSSSNPAVATIGSVSGIVSALTAGTTAISYAIGTGCFVSEVVTVNNAPVAITGTTLINAGATTTLSIASTGGTWSSSNTLVANVGSTTGVVTGVAGGTATISYRVGGGCFSVITVTVACVPTINIITTILGNGTSGSGPTSGLATMSIGGAWGIGSDASGNTYVCEFSNSRIRKIAPSGIVTTVAGTGAAGFSGDGGAATAAQISSPTGLYVKGTDIYFVDNGNSRIRKIDASGIITTVAGGGVSTANGVAATSAVLSGVNGVFVDASGNIYYPEQVPVRVRKINTSGIVTTIAGTGSSGSSGDGGQATAATFMLPNDVVVDATGNIFIADYSNNKIRRIAAGTGGITTYAGTGIAGYTGDGAAAASARINGPGGMTFDAGGNLLFCDTENQRIRKINKATGVITTYAGTGTAGYNGDGGLADTSRVNRPHRIFRNNSDEVLVADINNNRCRKIYAVPALIKAPVSVCVGSVTTMNAIPTGGTWKSSNTVTAAISTTGILFAFAAGTTVLSYRSAGGCVATTIATVNAYPVVSGPTDVCVGSSATLIVATGGGTWSSSNPARATVSSFGVVSGISAGTVTISYAVGTCMSTYAMTVQALDISGGGSPICVGGSISLTGSPGGGTWSSNAPGVADVSSSGVVTGFSTGTANISYTISYGCYNIRQVTVNSSSASISGSLAVCTGGTSTLLASPGGGTWSAGNSNVTIGSTSGVVTAVSAGTTVITYVLSSCVATAVVTVSGLASVSAGSDVTICVGQSTTLTATGATIYTWSPGATLSATTGVSVSASPTVTTTYSVTGVSGGCSGIGIVTVSVNPLPSVIAGPNGTICAGQSTPLIASGATTYTWLPSASLSASTGAVVTANPVATTTYTVTGILNGCSGSATVFVSVNALPTVTAGPPATICAGSFTTLTASGATTYVWTPSTTLSASTGSSVVASPTVATTYTVTGTDNGCSNTATAMVSVNPLPSVSGGSDVTICVGATAVLNASGATTYTWTPATTLSASTGTSVTASPTITTTYAVTGILNGCANVATVMVSVNPLPTVSAGADVTICEGEVASLSSTGATTYTWTPAASLSASTGFTVLASPSVTTTYTVTGMLNGCSNTATVMVSVNANPVVAAGGGGTICAGDMATLTATGAVDYSWSPGYGLSATTGSSVSASPSATVVYTVTGTASTGCSNTATVQVSVNPLPSVSPGSDVNICFGFSTPLTATGAATYTWTPGAGLSATTGASVTASPTVTTTYTVTGTLNGCSSPATKTVVVNPMPDTISGPPSVCIGRTITLINAVSGGTWSSSNPAVVTVGSSTGIVSGISHGTSTITYMLPDGCYRTKTITGGVLASGITGGPYVCKGSSVTLSYPITGGTWSCNLPYQANIDSITGVLTGITAGAVFITYTLDTGCRTATTVTVLNISLYPTGNVPLCEGNATTLSCATAPGGTWITDNPAIATINGVTGYMAGIAAGTVIITYQYAHCAKYLIATVNPVPAPVVADVSTICVGSTATFTNSTSGGSWHSSNTAVAVVGSSSGVVTGVAGGVAAISYRLPTGCGSAHGLVVGVMPAPITGTTSLCEGSNTTLSCATTGGTWSLSSSTVASVFSLSGGTVVLTGVAPGVVTVSYSTSGGCVQTVAVTVSAAPVSITGTMGICVGGSTALASGSGGTWSSSNTTVAVVGSGTGLLTGISPGTSSVTYHTGSTCYAIAVATVIAPSAISGPSSVCIGRTVSLSHSTGGGTWSSSNTSLATVHAATGEVLGISSGSVNISYVISSGCTVVKTIMVNVNPPALSGVAAVCSGNFTVLSGMSGGAAAWTTSDSSIATVSSSGAVSGLAPGVATVTYTNTTTGCFVTKSVTVNEAPSSISGSSAICVGADEIYTSTPSGGTWTSSAPAVGSINATTGVGTGRTGGGTTIRYTLPSGCFVTRTVTVMPLPGAITGAMLVCVGNTITLSASTTGGSWSTSATGAAAIVATTSTTSTIAGIAPGTAVISYSMGSGCPRTAIVTVNAAVAPITGSGVVCKDGTIALANATGGGTWSSSALSKLGVGTYTGIATGVAVGTAIVTYKVGVGCFVTRPVTVNATLPNILGASYTCSGAAGAVTFTNAVSGGTWSSANTAVATVDASSGLVTGVLSGGSNTYVNIIYSTGEGCLKSKSILIKPLPLISGADEVAVGSIIALSASPAGGSWISGAPGVASVGVASGIVTGVSVGSVVISCTVAGCVGTRDIEVIAAGSRLAGGDTPQFSISPNPTQGSVLVTTSVGGTFVIYAVDGKQILTREMNGGSNAISLPADVAPGIYVCRFIGQDRTLHTARLVYNH